MNNTLANIAEQRPGQIAVDVAVASILVYVDFDAQSDNRIKIAADWARKFDASLIGVAGWLPGREIGGWFAAELEPTKERNDRILVELENLGEHFGIPREPNNTNCRVEKQLSFSARRHSS